jgi:glycosyltransferase involved in cell wall biosynthesis
LTLSVIIPCFNAAETIGVQLDALAKQHWSEPWEVIISDNGSTDGSVKIAEGYKDRLPSLKVVDSSARKGAAHARNLGVQNATGSKLVFCDADDEVADGWLAAIGEALSRFDFVASRFDIEKLNEPWVRESHLNPQENGLNVYNYPRYLPHTSASGLGVKRKVHEAVGGFDESMRILEDTDYCWRIQLSGVEFHFVPEAVVHYRYRNTLGGIYRQARTYAEYNVLLYKKYRPLGMPKLPWELVWKEWKKVYWLTRSIRNKTSLAKWLWQFGWRIGRLRGCWRYRVFAP